MKVQKKCLSSKRGRVRWHRTQKLEKQSANKQKDKTSKKTCFLFQVTNHEWQTRNVGT